MRVFNIIDNELCIMDDDTLYHVFERNTFSRATYTYMINWIQKNKTTSDDIDGMWEEAEEAWDKLSPETQGLMVAIANKERQQAEDIRDGLLATLHGYHGLKSIKDSFTESIQSCCSLW
jgi:hypothetical protein